MAFDDLGKGLAAASGQKRMTPEQLAQLQRISKQSARAVTVDSVAVLDEALNDCLAHIDALTSDLKRATTKLSKARDALHYYARDDIYGVNGNLDYGAWARTAIIETEPS